MSRKTGPVRQLSLQCETQGFPVKRPPLKKQFSEEIHEGPIRISLSAKSRIQVEDRPAPVKIAWSEENKDLKSGRVVKDSILSQKDSVNSQKDAFVSQRDSILSQKNTILSQKNSSQRNTILSQRDSNISQRDLNISQKDSTQKNTILSQRDSIISQKDSILSQKDSIDSHKDYNLLQKDSIHSHRDSILSQKDSIYSHKDSILSQKDSIHSHKDSILAQKDSIHSHKDSILAQKDSIHSHKDSILSQRDSIPSQKGSILSQKDGMPSHTQKDFILAQRDSILSQKNSIHSQKDSILSQNNSILSQKDSILFQKNSILSQKDSIVSQKNSTLSQKDSILSQKNGVFPQKDSKQDLAERLRLAWKNREKSKQNLSIFLAHKSNEEDYPEQSEETPVANDRVPKIIQPLQNETQDSDLKQIFRKHMSRSPSISSSYSPTRTDDDKSANRADAIVVVPIIERPKIAKQASLSEGSERSSGKIAKQASLAENLEKSSGKIAKQSENPERASAKITKQDSFSDNKLFSEAPAVVMSRPSTAAGKREVFQKRTSSAFQTRSDGFRPPLVRASSVPCKQENKPKFLATKRRLRGKKKDKIDEEDKMDAKKGDIITMVSLISPTGSDCEEEVDRSPPSPVKVKEDTPPKTPNVQRKLPKSVSFQHSSIHTVRSFSASFPSRRGSVATALLIGNASKKLVSQKINEKRGNDEVQIGPKRRLLRAASLDSRSDHADEDSEPTEEEKQHGIRTEPSQSLEIKNDNDKESAIAAIPEEAKVEEEEEDPKEKECWSMYCKMNQRGLSVSFDTILRGMLTPTEYRIRRKIIEKREAEINPPTND